MHNLGPTEYSKSTTTEIYLFLIYFIYLKLILFLKLKLHMKYINQTVKATVK